jgi:hypothetical protein
MSSVALGILLIIIGFLIMLYGFGTLNFIIIAIGIAVFMGIGFWILATKFKQWVLSH